MVHVIKFNSIQQNVVSQTLTKVSHDVTMTYNVVNQRISHASRVTFKFFNDLFSRLSLYFFGERKVVIVPKKDQSCFLAKIMGNALNQVKNDEMPKAEPTVKVNKLATCAAETATVGAPVYLALEAQLSEHSSFFQQQAMLQATSESLKPSIAAFFGDSIDQAQFTSHGMVLKGDQMDHSLYQLSILFTATLFNTLTLGTITPQLHLIATAVAGITPLENAIMSFKVSKKMSKKAHELSVKACELTNRAQEKVNELRAKARTASVNLIKPFVLRLMEPQLIAAANAAQTLGEQKIESLKQDLELEMPDLSRFNQVLNNRFVRKLVKIGIQHHVVKPATNMVAGAIDAMATSLSESILDQVLSPAYRIQYHMQDIVMAALNVRIFDKTMKTAYMKNPLFAGVTVIMAGGMNQSHTELTSRIAGAAMLVITGQTIWPIIFVYGPRFVAYLIDLKEAYDVVSEEEALEDASSVRIEEVLLDEDVMPDPLGFMGGNHFEPIEEAPQATEAEIVRKAAFGRIMGMGEEEIVIDDNSPSMLDHLFTSFFIKSQEEVDAEAELMMGL